MDFSTLIVVVVIAFAELDAPRQTARGCAGSPWPQSGAERWNYRQSDGEDDQKRGIRGYDGGKRTLGRKRHIVVDVLGLLAIINAADL